MRLNVGCGDDVRDGYVNVDFRKTRGSVLAVDLSIFPWPFDDESAEQILMLDFLEHFPYSMTGLILGECYRVLHPDGEVVIQVPDGGLLSRVISGLGTFPCNRCGTELAGRNNDSGEWLEHCPKCKQNEGDTLDAAVHRMFGGQDYPGNFHHNCFTRDSLSRIARSRGLYWNRYEESEHQRLNWNFKSVFTKGDVW